MQPYSNWRNPKQGLILYGYRGSIAHNMYIPNNKVNSIDDIDTMGIYIDTIDNYFGIPKQKNRGTCESFIGKYDIVCYEIRKIFSLLLKCNPNVMGLLWLKATHYIKIKPYGELIIKNRNLFISKQAYYSFTGYAYGQLKRMESHAKKGFMGEKRKALVDKYGYDCKNAAHLIRLLKMGIEFLLTGELNVFRHDAKMLLEIKNGEWKLDQIKKEAKRLFVMSEEAFLKSKLPDRPDKIKAERILIDILIDNFKDFKENENEE